MSGKLSSTKVVAAQKGTTVCVNELFQNLPVRRRELERNIKREWNRVVGLLSQYACIQTGVKFTVFQTPNKGKRIVLFSTKGNQTHRENLINVFGAKIMTCLTSLDLKLEIEPTKGPHLSALADGNAATEVRVIGFVSKPSPGQGRNTPDRQMFYVNGRPCGLPQLAKVFNEAYRSYAPNQSPFIFADIKLDTHLYDVNVSPDKRSILLHDQGKLLDSLREALIELFQNHMQTVPISQPSLSKHLKPFKKPGVFGSCNATDPNVESPANLDTDGVDTWDSAEKEISSHHDQSSIQNPKAKNTLDTSVKAATASGSTSGLARQQSKPVASETHAEYSQQNISRGSLQSPIAKKDANNALIFREADIYKGQNKRTSVESQVERDGRLPSPNQEKTSEVPSTEFPHHKSPLTDKDFARLPASQTPQRIKDFHSMLAEIRTSTKSLHNPAYNEDQTILPPPVQSSIRSVSPKGRQMPSPPTIGQNMPRAPKRSTPEVASITIGDTTVTTVLDSHSKRPKIKELSSAASQKSMISIGTQAPRKKAKKDITAPLPSFGGRLAQMFTVAAAEQESQNQGALRATRKSSYDTDEDQNEEIEMGDENVNAVRYSSLMEVDGTDHKSQSTLEEQSDKDVLFTSEDPRKQLGLSQINRMPDILSDTRCHSPVANDEKHDIMIPEKLEESHNKKGSEPPASEHEDDISFITEEEKKRAEDDKVMALIAQAEANALENSELALKRAACLIKPPLSVKKRDATNHLMTRFEVTEEDIVAFMDAVGFVDEYIGVAAQETYNSSIRVNKPDLRDGGEEDQDSNQDGINATPDAAEEKLESLIIDKYDFEKLEVIGQFNLGFIIAVRKSQEAELEGEPGRCSDMTVAGRNQDDLFIIDQHASDEKFNFERLQMTTAVKAQRLVHGKQLELTALEEEIILNNIPALEANGFKVHVDASGDVPVGKRVELLSLPTSREITFDLTDFEELVALLGDWQGIATEVGNITDDDEQSSTHHNVGTRDKMPKQKREVDLAKIPRPSKVRKMFAMRACRSSVMIGRALTKPQMTRLVRQMATMDKPWNCPHGRPTMRHLVRLDKGLGILGSKADRINFSQRGGYSCGVDNGGDEIDPNALEWERYQRKKGRL